MADVTRCANCHSGNIQWQPQSVQCMDCGARTSLQSGKVLDPKKNESLSLNDTPEPTYETIPGGEKAGRPRTPDGVPDHGTNLQGDVPRSANEGAEASWRDNTTNETQH